MKINFMVPRVKFLLVAVVSALLFTSCSRESSFENGGSVTGIQTGTAVFSFNGAPTSCTGASVNGVYTTGTALSSGNTVVLSVNVTTVGTYTLTTNTDDGIQFSVTDSFTATGTQTITLRGSGTPAAAGTFTFKPGSNGCTFTVTVAGGGSSGGTASYTFAGVPGNCTTPVVGGTYTAGTALGTADTVSLAVSVTSVGTYSVSTATVNGISFSGSGTFTTTGPQTIKLTGSGTPLAGGAFSYIPGSTGCSFSITVAPAGSATNIYFYEATVDGVYYKETVTDTNGFEAGSGLLGADDAIPFATILATANPRPAGTTGLSIQKGILHGYLSASNATFKNFFTPGTYPYAASTSVDGVGIDWYDETSLLAWTTQNAPGTQTGSTFQITEVSDVSTLLGYYIKVNAIFNCKVYNESGNVKTITNGKFVGLFGKI